MKKKVLYGVIMAFFSILAIGTLQSCKDDLSDFEKKYGFDQEQLKAQLDDLQNQLNDCRNNCQTEHNKLWTAVNANTAQNKINQDSIALLAQAISKMATTDLLNQKINDLRNELNANIDAKALELDGKIGELNGLITRLDEKFSEKFTTLEGKYNDLDTKVGALSATVEAQKASIEAVVNSLNELSSNVADIKNDVAGVKEGVDALTQKYEAIQADVEDLWNEIAGPGGIKDQIGMVINTVMDIDNRLDFLMQRFDQLITEIISQATDSPVFGNFSLPLGIQSKLLFEWCGFNGVEAFNFPSTASEYNYYDAAPVFTQADQERIGSISKETIGKGVLGDVKLGNLYMTINPVGHYFDNDAFSLETSAEKKFPAVLNVKKSDKELIFGYHRSVSESNGFYEAEVVLPKNEVLNNKIVIEEGLKEAVKDALKDKSKRNAINLLKAIYSQLNGMLPSYAVRYDWSVMNQEGNMQPYSVLSSYDIAAATAQPLSYSFLYGKGTTKRVPTFGHIDNLILKLKEEGKLHFTFEPITFDDIAISLPEINITPKDVEPGDNNKVTVHVGVIKVYETGHLNDPDYLIGETEDLSYEADGIDGIVEDLTDKINESIQSITSQIKDWTGTANEDLTAQIRDALDPVAKKINDMMESINGQIDDMLGELGDEFQPYFDRLNKLIDIYNKVAGKINNFLSDPNHYLQVAMFYNGGNGNMGLLSTKLTDPTVFTGTKKYVGLYASSYTAEIVAPAYKKYVAVSNVYNADFTQASDAAAKVQAINSASEFFNEVMDGHTIRYSIPAAKLEKGKIYEIVYQGVDYAGRTSTQKFYIKVK